MLFHQSIIYQLRYFTFVLRVAKDKQYDKIILGIDPGTIVTGFGVIEKISNQISYVASGQIKANAASIPERLTTIFAGIEEVTAKFFPDLVVVEQAFAHKNMATAIKLGQARGVAMVAASKTGCNVYEYTPRQIKQAVVGSGGADKSQVQHMVKAILNLPSTPQADAADALAVALCHGNSHQSLEKLAGQAKKTVRGRLR